MRKGVRVPIGVPERGVWERVQRAVGGRFSYGKKGKGEGSGEGEGGGGGKSMRKLCRSYPLAIYPLVFPRCEGFMRHRPPRTSPSNPPRPPPPPSGVDLASIQL